MSNTTEKLRSYVARLVQELDHFLEGEYSTHWYGEGELWTLNEAREVRDIADQHEGDRGRQTDVWAAEDAASEVRRLRAGIRQHMEVRGNDPDKTQADFDLWALLAEDERVIPDTGDAASDTERGF